MGLGEDRWGGWGGGWLPDVIGAAGCFAVAVFPGALRDGPGPVGEQLVPQVAGETSRAVWWSGRKKKSLRRRPSVEASPLCRVGPGRTGRGTRPARSLSSKWVRDRMRRSHPQKRDGAVAHRAASLAGIAEKKTTEGKRPCKRESVSENTRGAQRLPSGEGGGGVPVHLPEAFCVGDEEVGVRWVAMATRHLDRARAVPGG